VKTEDNKAESFTKNVHGDVYDKHVDGFISDQKEFACENEQHGRVLELCSPFPLT
jgi:hypothetical protein